MRFYLLISVLLLITVGCNEGNVVEKSKKEEGATTKKLSPEWEQFSTDYQIYFKDLFEASGVPGAALTVVHDGIPILQEGFGLREVGRSSPVTKHTKFRLGSVSKTFAALTAAKVIEAGMASWSTPVATLVPEFSITPRSQTARVQLQHILSHTSGFPPHAYTNLLEAGLSIEEIAGHLHEVKHVKPEGEHYAYQNVAFALVEPFLEKSTGKKYVELLEQMIFEPTGMKNASTSLEALNQANNVALPHRAVGNNGQFKKINLSKKYYNAVSAGGINASIKDMTNYLQVLQGKRPEIASDSLLQYLFTPRITSKFERRYFDKWKGTNSAHYALGWRVINYQGRDIVYHGGFVNGFRAEIFIDPEMKVGACLLLNASSPFANDFLPNFFKFHDTYWQALKKPEEPKPLS